MAKAKSHRSFAGLPMGKPKRGPLTENQLKVWRAKRNLTQGELADEIGVSRQTIIAIEAGKYSPSLELAFRFSRFFGTTIEGIFSFKDKSKYSFPF